MTRGKNIKCKFCEYPDAIILLEEGRYMVQCSACWAKYYLKEQHIKQSNKAKV